MDKYDKQDDNEKQNQQFVNLLQNDNKLRQFFEDNYAPGADSADDEKFISYVFSQYAEQGWS